MTDNEATSHTATNFSVFAFDIFSRQDEIDSAILSQNAMLKGTINQHIILPVHPQLSKDTLPVVQTEHCHIRLMNDSRWPWIILIPVDDEIAELHQLPTALRHAFMDQVNQVATCLQDLTKCRSINVAMLGNVVSQLHCHVIARDERDPNWPGPVWGFGESVPYSEHPGWLGSLKSTLGGDLGA